MKSDKDENIPMLHVQKVVMSSIHFFFKPLNVQTIVEGDSSPFQMVKKCIINLMDMKR